MKISKNAIRSLAFASMLATVSVAGMETQYREITPESTWIEVYMNEGRSINVPAQSKESHTFWTDKLMGCVVTIINLEYYNGDHTIAMCHYPPHKKELNKAYLNNFLNNLETQDKLAFIKNASCIIIPPGVSGTYRNLTPVFDDAWQKMIKEIVSSKIPSITFEISPYFFNEKASGVKYTFQSGRAKGLIVNKSRIADELQRDLLFENHNCEEVYDPAKIIIPFLIVSGIIISLYYLTK